MLKKRVFILFLTTLPLLALIIFVGGLRPPAAQAKTVPDGLSSSEWSSIQNQIRASLTIVEQAKLTAGDAAVDDLFGSSVAVSGDTAVIGAVGDDGYRGAAYVFVRSGNSWRQQQKLIASDAAAGDQLGYAVAVAGDTVVVGVVGDDDAGLTSGSAYVFVRSGDSWSQQQKLTASDAAAGDQFGSYIALSDDGNTAVIAAADNDDAGSRSGSAYIFFRSGSIWSEQEKLTASDAAENDSFGSSVAVSGDTAVIGATGDDSRTGSAYVFTRSGSSWSEQQKLTASDAADYDYFGKSVAVFGDTAVVGAIGDSDSGVFSGSVYVFVRSGTTWSQTQKLAASDAAANVRFGTSIAMSGDTAVIGAYGDNSKKGWAYIFVRSGGTWSQEKKLTASDAATDDKLGRAVAVSGNTIVIGAAYDDDSAILQDSGSAYVFVSYKPEIDVQGNGLTIVNGDSTPALADDTDFGYTQVSAAPITRTFTIINSGNMTLTLTGFPIVTLTTGTHFSITAQPVISTLLGSTQTTFTVSFAPMSTGNFTDTINIANTDANEAPYSFVIAGTTNNLPPTADAGTPQTVRLGASVTLNGSGSSDPNGSLTYHWTQTGGDSVTLSDNSVMSPTFTAPTASGVLTFSLTVTDTGGLTDSDNVTVTVNHTVYLPMIVR